MKILQVHNFYRVRGGEDVVVEREARSLRGAGHEVVEHYAHSARAGALKAVVGMAYSKRAKRSLALAIDSQRPDLVHVHNYFPLFSTAVFEAAHEAGVPVVHSLHNFRMFCANGLLLREGHNCHLCLGMEKSSWPGVRHGCYRESSLATLPVAGMIAQGKQRGIWDFVNAFLCSTKFTKDLFVEAGIPAEKIFLKPNSCPDLSEIHHREERGHVLYLGRLSEEKGIRTLVESWRGSKIPLRFCGDGPMAEWVEEQGFPVASLPQAEALGLLAGATCLVMPTECHEAGFPLVLIEALSLGVPVVASRFGASGQYFLQERNALLFEPGDRVGLRAMIDRLWADSELRKRIGAGGRALYEANFREESNLENLISIYRKVLAGQHSC